MTSDVDSGRRGSAALPFAALIGGVALGAALTVGASKVGLFDLAGQRPASAAFVHPDPFVTRQAGRFGSSTVPGSAAVPAPGQSSPANMPSVETMIGQLRARLEADPGDADGWRMLGWTFLNQGRYTDAVDAYRKVVELVPDNAKAAASLGEALVRQAEGRVTDEAIEVFRRVTALDGQEPRSRFFLGLAKAQAGDASAAIRDWEALVASAPPEADWVPDVKARILELSRQAGLAPGVAPVTAPGPSAADVAAASAMPEEERAAMIRGMVDRLAARLEDSPRDADGWIRLVRSLKVLGEEERARDALRRGLDAFSDAPAEQQRMAAEAAVLGVTMR